ncbi:hypothetical protein D6827_02235, partial [Candidatus Parcubacteria bacterium]
NLTAKDPRLIIPRSWCRRHGVTPADVAQELIRLRAVIRATVLREMVRTGLLCGPVNLDVVLWTESGQVKGAITDPNIRHGGSLFARRHLDAELRRLKGYAKDRVVGSFYASLPAGAQTPGVVAALEAAGVGRPQGIEPWVMACVPGAPERQRWSMFIASAPDLASFGEARLAAEAILA